MTRPTYCLTGTFELGTLRDVSAVLNKLKCRVLEDMSGKVDFLLIGAETEGRTATIDAALDLIFQGHTITLLHEDHWLDSLEDSEEVQDILSKAALLPDGTAFRRAPSKAKAVLWEGDHLVRFRYRNSKGEETDREIKLRKVSGENGKPIDLSGFCLLRKMNRTFKAANVIAAEIIDGQSGEIGELRDLLARL